jgi:hypothetical protein
VRAAALALLLAAAGCDRDALPGGGPDGAGAVDATAGGGDAAGPPGDAAITPGGIPTGIWLVGWVGHLNHYSWVRLDGADPFAGPADFLDGHDLTANGPYWPCNGAGSWGATQKPDTLMVRFPPACNLPDRTYTLGPYQPPGTWPRGADLYAPWQDLSTTQPVEGYHFPPSQCDPAFTQCTDPLKP